MPEYRRNDMEPEERIEALSDYLDQMEEEAFDPAIVDRCLAAMEVLEPEASEFDAEEALRTFREKHRDLIRGDRDSRVGAARPGRVLRIPQAPGDGSLPPASRLWQRWRHSAAC